MEAQITNEVLEKISFLKGLNDKELAQVAGLCTKHSYTTGETCQAEGQPTNQINLIIMGKVGIVYRFSSVYSRGEITTDIFRDGEVFGWSALLHGAPWSTLKALEPTEVLQINIDELTNLCETNHDIGYYLMRNLASLISTRFRRNRMSLLNVIEY